MLSLEITDIGKFTKLLFAENAFDRFLLREMTLVTAFTVSFDGSLNQEFFTEEEQKELSDSCVSWSELRPTAYKLISGKKLPVSFKIVLLTSAKTTENLMRRSGFNDCPVSSLSLNLLYREKRLLLTTGAAYQGFSTDKSLEKEWETQICSFLEKNECGFEEL